MNSIRIVISAIAVVSWASGAMGQVAQRPPVAPPKAEPIPRSAFIATMDAEFRGMDADKNGIITRKEIEDLQRVASVLAARQRNAGLFQALDMDRNGQLTSAEFAALPMNVAQPNAAPVLAQVDGNRDGQATLIEYRAGKLVNFDRIDTDKDGVATVAEMKAAGVIK